MIETTNAALKEWAIVCKALAEGRQILLIRKGGIEEIKGGTASPLVFSTGTSPACTC